MPPVPTRRSYSLLIIGRAADLHAIAAAAIRGLACEVDAVSSVEDGLVRLGEADYDTILAELDEPDDRYLDRLRAIRAARPDARLILIVDHATSNTVIAAIREDAFSYFSRPFDTDLVVGMVRQALQVRGWEDDIEVLSAEPNYLTLKLRCAIDTADRLVQFCREMPVELPAEEKQSVADAFREMLLNAIEHGGKLNPEDWVRVTRARTQRTLVYYIQDPGDGFRRAEMSHAAAAEGGDPTAHVELRMEQGMRPGGFGILITSHLVDEVMYNEQGNEVILIKHLD